MGAELLNPRQPSTRPASPASTLRSLDRVRDHDWGRAGAPG